MTKAWDLGDVKVDYLSKKQEDEAFTPQRKSKVSPAELDNMLAETNGNTAPAKVKVKVKKTVAAAPGKETDSFDDFLKKTNTKPAAKADAWEPCHKSHPPLKIPVGDKMYEIYGGSCIHPKITDMDVFIGLDSGMTKTSRQFPWHPGTEFLYYIQDMSVPKEVEEFKQLLNFLKDSLVSGKKVFVGCIGGHGRTGIVFSALVNLMSNMEDSTTYVRENYCKKVVESEAQVDWLHTHFGIKKVDATKGFKSHNAGSTGLQSWDTSYSTTPKKAVPKKHTEMGAPSGYGVDLKASAISPVACEFNIHTGNTVLKA